MGSPRLGYPSLSLPSCPRLYPHCETHCLYGSSHSPGLPVIKPGELHGYCGAPSQPAGLRSYWEKQGAGRKLGAMHVYLVQLHYAQCTCLFTTYIQGRSRTPGSLDAATHSINVLTPPLDDQIFWSQQSKQEEDSLSWYRAPSVDVELTSSILMAHLTKSSLSSDEIKKASKIVSWLTKQQNPYGGFASTQVIPLSHHHHYHI